MKQILKMSAMNYVPMFPNDQKPYTLILLKIITLL